ncbi:MAG: D-glycero-beta-D-manno-heptose 1-phosphate adenylyltransferase [Planctomycetota bacterium]|nr:D-glycero-beta-D-manno-heptose 1-phosphate adenylyltransferase [Planctomycetota bacterium]
MSDLLTRLSAWKPFRVLVVGDFMLDETVLGDAERLTGDAPVPVLHVRETRRTPGGAASVCMNLAAMRGSVMALGLVGDDAEGRALALALAEAGVDVSGLVVDPSRPTTVKRSLVGRAQHRHPQKMFRVDVEAREPIGAEAEERLLRVFDAALAGADVVALEDYDKGVFRGGLARKLIDRCRARGKDVLVDPARLSDYGRYRGATCITPNRTEAETATGLPTHPSADMEHNAELAAALQSAHDIEAVVLTLDRHGALLLERGQRPLTVPTVAREVYDVTGAGDMVLAALAAARANGAGWPDAVRLANTAAGLEVEVFGVQPIPIERIHAQVLLEQRRLSGKTRTLEEALVEAAAARREGRRVVFTNGCFDVIHAGHIRLLQQAARLGGLLVVGLNSDESVKRLKGPARPVHGAADRASILGELRSVDVVVVFEEDTPVRLLEALRPDVLVKGGDYTKDRVVGGAFVESYGGEVVLIPALEGRSTTEAIARMRSGTPAGASCDATAALGA